MPGQNLVAPAAPGSFLSVAYPSLLVKDTYGLPAYISLSGTSMAAGVESGLVAVILEASRAKVQSLTGTMGRGLTANAIKALSEYSAFTMHDATGVTYDRLAQGAGRVNGAGLLTLARSANPTVPAGTPWLTNSVVPYTPSVASRGLVSELSGQRVGRERRLG